MPEASHKMYLSESGERKENMGWIASRGREGWLAQLTQALRSPSAVNRAQRKNFTPFHALEPALAGLTRVAREFEPRAGRIRAGMGYAYSRILPNKFLHPRRHPIWQKDPRLRERRVGIPALQANYIF